MLIYAVRDLVMRKLPRAWHWAAWPDRVYLVLAPSLLIVSLHLLSTVSKPSQTLLPLGFLMLSTFSTLLGWVDAIEYAEFRDDFDAFHAAKKKDQAT